MNAYKLRIYEAMCLILTILLINLFLQVPSYLISNTGSSTLINIIYISCIVILLFFLIYSIFSKFPGMDIVDISEFLGGKFLKVTFGLFYIIFIFLSTAVIIRLFSESLSLIYFSHININFIILSLIIICGIINSLGFKTICRLNVIIFPIMLFSIIFLFFSSINNYTFQRFFPLLGYGIKETFINGIENIFSFGGIFLLFFIFPFLNKKNEFKKVGIYSILIYSFLLLLCTSSLLFSFPQSEKTSSPLSLYLLARQISFGTYIQSIDAFFLLIWIPFLLSYLSIKINFSLSIFQKIANTKYSNGMLYAFCTILYIISIFSRKIFEINFFSNEIYKYLILLFVFLFSFIILILAYIKKILRKR